MNLDSGVDKDRADSTVLGPSKVQKTEIRCGFFRAGSVLLIEGSILVPCFEIWE
jgi:hypothetical protein